MFCQSQCSIRRKDNDNGNLKSGFTARIPPESQEDDTLRVDSEEEDADGQGGDDVEVDDGNFLSEFPDDTPVWVFTTE